MKQVMLLLALASLAACTKQAAEQSQTHERPPENGAQYKDREGVALTEVMRKSIGLQTAEVAEEKVAPQFTIELNVMTGAPGFQKVAFSPTSRIAAGWLTTEQASIAKTVMQIELRADGEDGALKGVVKAIEKSPYQTTGDFEVTIEAEEPLELGTRVFATFRGQAGEPVAAIPKSALLKTAEGHFVYAVNGERYVRTAVKLGAQNGDAVEITDGLYTGDQVVTAGVTPLWLAELQVLRGGKACTCGH